MDLWFVENLCFVKIYLHYNKDLGNHKIKYRKQSIYEYEKNCNVWLSK